MIKDAESITWWSRMLSQALTRNRGEEECQSVGQWYSNRQFFIGPPKESVFGDDRDVVKQRKWKKREKKTKQKWMHTLKKKGLVNVLTAFVFSVVCVYRKLKRLELDTLFLKQRRDGRKKDTKRGGETKCGLMKEFCFSFVKRKKKGRKYRRSWAWNRREWSRTGWPGMAEQTVEQKQKKEEIICKIRPTSLKSERERELRRLNTIGCTGRRYVYNKWNIFGRETGYSFRQWLHCPGETMGNSYVLKRMYPKHPNVNFNPYESSFNWSGGMNSLAWYSFSPSSFIHTDYARRHLTRQSFPMFMQQKKKKALSEIDISETLLFLISGDIAALRQEKGWSWLSQSGKERESETMGERSFSFAAFEYFH